MAISVKVRRIGYAGFVACLATMALAVRPSQAVVCPEGEPDFVYNDVGSDGCFNVGTDAQIPDASLFAGTYTAAMGGIVVPLGVAVEPPMGNALTWNATTFFIRGDIEASGAIQMSGNEIQVETTAEILGVSAGFNMNNNVIVGDRAKITAATGQLSISQGGSCIVGTSARLTGHSVSVSSSGSIVIGEQSDIEATGAAVNVHSNVHVELLSGVDVVSVASMTISSSGTQVFADGVALTAGGGVVLGGNGNTTIGEGVKVNSNNIYIDGANIVAGAKLSLVSAGNIAVLGDTVQLGDKLKMTSATLLYISSSVGSISLGSAKLTAGDDIAIGAADEVVLQSKDKLTTQGNLIMMSVNGVSIGANSKLSAGEYIDLDSSSPTLGGILLQDAVKLTSGTLKDPMAPSQIGLHGFSVSVQQKSSLRGADLNNTILLDPLSELSVSNAKLAGKIITLGDDANAPFAAFGFTDSKVKGSADGATFTIHAPGTACNLTGSTFTNIALDSSSCSSVVGP